jgi:hypothetical protein
MVNNRINTFILFSFIGFLDLKKEPFFQTIDWDNLANAPAPFIPVPDNDSDTFYFEGKFFFSFSKNSF